MFDSRKYLESLAKPTFIAPDGTEFVGELVSFNTVVPILNDMTNLTDDSTMPDVANLVERTVKAIKMDESAIPHILNLPIDGQLECLVSFFTVLRGVRKKAE